MKFIRASFLSLAISMIGYSCTDQQKDETRSTLMGKWTALWETDPASFPGVTNIESFKMDGEIIFHADSVQINAFGFPGCIFSADTLRHSLKWKISNDTLNFLNEDDIYGMSYTIKEIQENNVRLQLMDDIFLTLKK